MRSRFLLVYLLLLTLVANADDKKPAAAAAPQPAEKADDPSSFKTADDLWKHIEELQKEPDAKPKSREELLTILKSWFGKQKTAADAFLVRFPKDPHRYGAQLVSVQSSMQLARLPGGDAGLKQDPEKVNTLLAEIVAAPDAPEDVKGEAVFMQVMSQTRELDTDKPETLTAFFKASDEFLAKYGSHKLAPRMQQAQLQIAAKANTPEAEAVLEKIAAGKDAELADAAKQQIEKQKKVAQLKTKPVDLRFTAVDGSEVDLAKMRGKVVLIDFWATWCGPCVGEVPHVVETYKKLREKGFEIVGISLDQDKDQLLKFTKEKGMTWPQYFDGKGWQNEISSKFGIESIPAMWLIDKKGMLATTNARNDLEGEVEKLLAK